MEKRISALGPQQDNLFSQQNTHFLWFGCTLGAVRIDVMFHSIFYVVEVKTQKYFDSVT